MTHKCEFCNKNFYDKSNLNRHRHSSKKCIKIQKEKKIENIEPRFFLCNFCNKESSTKQSLNIHLNVCKLKIKDIDIDLVLTPNVPSEANIVLPPIISDSIQSQEVNNDKFQTDFEYMFDKKPIRVFRDEYNNIYFIAKDIAEVLDYKEPKKAIKNHVEKNEKLSYREYIQKIRGYPMYPLKLHPDTVLINESGFYSLIMTSNMPHAKKFKRWVTEDILPSIRKTGSYNVNKKELENVDTTKLLLENTVRLLIEQFNCDKKDFTGQNVMYFAFVGFFEDRFIFEFGESSKYSGEKGREIAHKNNKDFPCFEPIGVYQCANSLVCEGLFRDLIKKTNHIYKYKTYTELFTINTKEELLDMKKHMKDICEKNMEPVVLSSELRYEVELEKIKLEELKISNEHELEKMKIKENMVMQLLKDEKLTFEQKFKLINS